MMKGGMFIGFLLAGMESFAQFFGGDGDGAFAPAGMSRPLNTQSVYCTGGHADGSASAGSASAPLNPQSVLCTGGDGDGHQAGVLSGRMYPEQAFCGGGNGDGHGPAATVPAPMVTQAPWCGGAGGDGHGGSSTNAGYMSSQAIYCSGGIADGNASHIFSGNMLIQSAYCSGGTADGHASTSFSGVMFNSAAWCSGGNADGSGHAHSALSLFDQSGHCSGGNGDGSGSLATAPFAMGTGIWKGITGTSWSVASNWTNNIVPGQTTDVIIPPFRQYYPMLTDTLAINSASGPYRCRSLMIESGGSFGNTGPLMVSGLMTVAGMYLAITSASLTQHILSGGSLVLLSTGIAKFGNQSNGPALCDLKVYSGGRLEVEGGILEIDDQLQISSGGTFSMTGGTVFVHQYGEGSAYGGADPASLFVQAGATGFVSGGTVKVCGKTSSGKFGAVILNSPGFDFAGNSTLRLTHGISETKYNADISIAAGSTLNHLEVNKTGNTVSMLSSASLLGTLKVCSGSTLKINPGVSITVADSVVIQP